MDHWNIPSYTRHWRTLYQHKLQWYGWILDRLMAYHFGIILLHFLMVWGFTALVLGSSPVRPLSFHLAALLLSLAARLTWFFLFRDQARFAGLSRPGMNYRWAVIAVCGATTVPNLYVHVVVLERSLRGLAEEEASFMAATVGVVMSVLQTALLCRACALCVWMVLCFLVDWDDGMYEPCAKSELGGRGLRGAVEELEPALEPYFDAPASPVYNERRTAEINLLATAYTKQQIEASTVTQEPERSHQQETPSSTTEDEHGEETPGHPDASSSGGLTSAAERSPAPLRCPTVARYDYLDKNHSGVHSWLSYPFIPAFIFAYGSILSIPMMVLIIETQHSKNASPKAKKGLLYTLLGSYILCFYALKHRLRRSMFEKFELRSQIRGSKCRRSSADASSKDLMSSRQLRLTLVYAPCLILQYLAPQPFERRNICKLTMRILRPATSTGVTRADNGYRRLGPNLLFIEWDS